MQRRNAIRRISHITARSLALAGAASPLAAIADAYPERPVSLVVPFPPGGTTDVLARVVGEQLGKRIGGTFLIDNKPGANTIIGAQQVAKARPDGYTMLIAAGSTMVLNPLLRKQLSYNPERELDIIALTGDIPLVAVVPAASPIRNLDDLIARVKEKRAPLTYASVGVGSTLHLAGELFEDHAGAPMTHVAYKGSAPALADVISGQVSLIFDPGVSSLPHVKSGKLRALAITSSRRSESTPEIPTIAESGVPGYEASIWFGLVAPAGTPPAIVNRLSSEVTQIVRSPAMRERFTPFSLDLLGGTPDEFAATIRSEIPKWGKVLQDAKVEPE